MPPATGSPSGRSGRSSVRATSALLPLVLLLIAASAVSLTLGTRPVSLSELLSVAQAWLFASTSSLPPELREVSVIISTQRLPRTILALAAGAAMGLTGLVLQGLTRNPLADPGLLGVNAGASLAVVIAITFFGIERVADTVWFGFAGAGLTAGVVLAIARAGSVRGRTDPIGLVLAGAAVSAGLTAAVGVVVLRSPDALSAFRQWTVGSLVGRDIDVVASILPFIAVGTILALALAPSLDAILLGDDVASGLGASPGTIRILGMVAVTVLAGSTTAICGPLAFIGLVVPHVARLIAGRGHRLALPVSACVGAVLLLTSDVIGRVVARPAEIQVGILLSLIGAPVLLWLAMKTRPTS